MIEARQGVDHLSVVAHRKLWKAGKGRHGSGSNRHGRRGTDLLLHVPPGTVVIDAIEGFVIRDLTRPGDRVIAARGGKGGRGNAYFKSATNRAPRQFTRGEQGERRLVVLELKVIADVGLIGKPNAGKSTLLSRLSHARPEIADYPFTTKRPNLGRVRIDVDRSFIMADIPGLIEGAHQGSGLGHEFLRHVERAGVLVHLIEPIPMDGSDPCDNYRAIRDELIQYNEQLGRRPELVAVTKAELPGAGALRDRLSKQIGRDVLLISAVTGRGLDQLTVAIARLLHPNKEP
jgi:GTP-binding protein